MVRPERIVMAAGSLFAKLVVGLLMIAIAIGAGGLLPLADVPRSSGAVDRPSGATSDTVTMEVPPGALAKHLTVVDTTGRELAVLTFWISGTTTVVSARDDGANVSYNLNGNGSVNLRVEGTEQVTLIDAESDGKTRVLQRDVAVRVGRRVRRGAHAPASVETSRQTETIENPDASPPNQ